MTELSKERREKLRSATQYPFNTMLVQAPDPVDTVSIDFNDLRTLLDMADERDQLRALLERALPSIDWAELMGVINSRLGADIRAELEGKE